jgi:dsDNA-specific endonuclease/ATPase MutS2
VRLSEILKRLFGKPRRATRAFAERAAETASGEDEDNLDPFDPFPEPVRLEISDVFDLHTIQPREVRAVVEEYLREAHSRGFRSVRIIHGKGLGVQRETVRTVLARTEFVEHFSDAPPEAGGWGATVARLRASDPRD